MYKSKDFMTCVQSCDIEDSNYYSTVRKHAQSDFGKKTWTPSRSQVHELNIIKETQFFESNHDIACQDDVEES